MITEAKNKSQKPKQKTKKQIQKEKVLRDRYGIYPQASTAATLSKSDVHGEQNE